MKLHCRITPKDRRMQDSLIARLEAINCEPVAFDGSVFLDYEGPFDQHAMAIVSVFDSFGCDRAFIFKDWGKDDSQKPPRPPKKA